jgi:homoserine dehydrogenase
MTQKVNIVLFGIGKAGSALINKALKNRKTLILEDRIDLRFPVITNSTVAFFEKEGANYSWEANFIQFAIPFRLEDVVEYVHANKLHNLIAIDATGSPEFVRHYANLLRSGFNILSINETLATLHPDFKAEIARTAANTGMAYDFINLPKGDKKAAADELFIAILDIAAKERKVA